MKLFSFLRWIGNHRSNRARAGKRASANLALEGLEDRFLPSANVISGYVFNDANNNGLFDPGESPLANSTIQLRNASNTVVGTTVTDVNGFYQFSIDNTVSTAPTTLTRTANLAITSTDWTKSLSVRQFDPTLGTLLAVDILNAGSFVSDIKVESLDNAPSTITATDSGSLTLSGPGLASLMTTDSTSKSFSASAYDGIIDFAGTSGTDFGAQTANGANSFTVTSAADLASFTGTGSISFTEVAHATSSAAGAGNLITQISTTASAQVTVVFHYIPNNSLKPGSYILMQTSQPPNLLEGLESSNGMVIANSVGSDSIPVALGNGSSTNNDFAEISPASLSGYVYYDVNDNGVRDGGDQGIAGTTITLTGSNDLGTPANLTTTTAADGSYQFSNLRPGTYSLTETQSATYLQDKNTLGSLGGTPGNDQFSGIVVAPAAAGSNYDFGELLPAGLSGYVYSDLNDNGLRDSGDQPIAGTTVTLTGSNDLGTAVNLTTTTTADGSYQLSNLRPGTYALSEIQPAGYLQGKNSLGSLGGTAGNDLFSGIIVMPAAAGSNYNFGELLPAGLSGYVYSDLNDNGLRDSGDQPIAGTTIALTGSTDLGIAVNLTTTTAADGSYQFSNLRPGTYTLSETQPAGYLQGKNNLGSLGGTAGTDLFSGIIVMPAAAGSNYNFGEVLPASLSGYVYSDLNDSGLRDGGDQPIAGTTITLTGSNDLGTPVNLTTTTAADGSYEFTNLRPGTYTLTEMQPAGHLQGQNNLGSLGGTAGTDLFSGIIVTPAAAGSNYNFGELLPASLSGYVYSDLNDNGLRDSGDQPIAGTTITLTGSNDLGTPVNLTTTTGADGSYQFSNLRPGTYTLTETQPAGYLQGKNSLGSLGGTAGTDLFSGIIVMPAAAGSNYNFGEVLPASLSGYVYSDLNDNGLRDSGDPPIAGTTITLTGSNDLGTAVNLTTTTAADGSYQLSNLRPGTYTLSETQPAGYLQGKNNLGSLGGTAGNDVFSGIIVMPAATGSNYNFGELLPASLSGYVYSDANDNGLRDSGDQPIVGTTITLTGSTDLGTPVNLTTTTAADGSYQFTNLRPGTYTLTETQPAGYLQGQNNLGSLGGSAGNDLFSGIIVMPAATGSNYNFGNFLPASLSGYVYSDANDNGVRDSGDQPIAGTTITLAGSNDLGTAVNLTTTTAADGSYQFTNLRPGTYTITEAQPPGYFQGKDTIGSAGGVESIKDQFSSIPLTTGSSGNNYNFGEILPASIAGFVYVDANNNGVMDPGEADIANVIVTLTGTDDQANSLNQTTQTGANGSYAFGNLRPGVYAVTETPPISYDPGKIDVGSQGGTVGHNQIANIALGSGVHGTNYDFGHLQPTQEILASWFTIPNFSFGHPDLQILSKLAFLSTSPGGGTDPVVKVEATYVDGLYRAILGRPADPNGLVAFVMQLHNGLAPSQLVQDIWNSPEHRGLEVDSFYQNLLQRNADPAGRAYWVSAMLQGQSETDVEVQFLSSGEYAAAHATNADYIAALYADVLGRDATSTEIGGWAQALQNGESRSAVARAFLTSSEVFRQSLEIDYRAYLMRAPDAAGEQNWLAVLTSGQITPQAATEAFFASGEFLALAQQASEG